MFQNLRITLGTRMNCLIYAGLFWLLLVFLLLALACGVVVPPFENLDERRRKCLTSPSNRS